MVMHLETNEIYNFSIQKEQTMTNQLEGAAKRLLSEDKPVASLVRRKQTKIMSIIVEFVSTSQADSALESVKRYGYPIIGVLVANRAEFAPNFLEIFVDSPSSIRATDVVRAALTRSGFFFAVK